VRVLHVVASNQARGAEVSALDLIGELNRRGVEQRVAVIRRASDGLDYGAGCAWLTGSPLRSVARLHRLVRSLRPDVVHAHGGQALKWLTPTLLAPGSPPVVYRRIGMTPSWMAGSVRKRGYGFIIRRAGAIVAVAETAGQQLVDEFGVPSSSIDLIGNAVDEKRVRSSADPRDVKRRLQLDEEAPAVLFAGALTDEKNPLELIEICRLVRAVFPRVSFLVAGDGPLAGDLTSAVADAGLSDRIKLLGSRSDLPDLMRACDAVIMTSRTEGIPGVAIEAGLSRRPVVAYGVGGLPEVVTHGLTGLLAPHGDARALSDLLIQVLNDPSEARALGERAQVRCRELYGIEASGKRYLDLYNRLHKGRHKSETTRSPLMKRDQDITLTGEPR
jgi:glycosyltransferase involved in cell wall biosynthesis